MWSGELLGAEGWGMTCVMRSRMQQSSKACESVAGPVDMSRIRWARSIMIDRMVAKRDMYGEEEGRWVGKSSRQPAASLEVVPLANLTFCEQLNLFGRNQLDVR